MFASSKFSAIASEPIKASIDITDSDTLSDAAFVALSGSSRFSPLQPINKTSSVVKNSKNLVLTF